MKKMKNPCWKGYKAIGTKMKNGREVPNCVPVSEELGPENEWGTPELTKKMLEMTPGQTKKKLLSFKEFENTVDVAVEDVPEHPEGNENEYYYAEETMDEAAPAWQRKEGKSASGGLNRKGIASYRRANPGSKLSMAVTTKPSKLKKGSKAAKRRKSFCARMSGMKRRLTSAKTSRDPDSRINKALRKWNCN
jgi:hypothetical protein